MIKRNLILLLFFIFAVHCFADNAVGLWKSMEKNGTVTGVWKFYIEDGTLYGVCLAAMDKPIDIILSACKDSYSEHPVKSGFNKLRRIDAPLIYRLTKMSDGVWINGYIIDARDGKRWSCNIIFHDADGKKFKVKTLEMRGGLGLIKVSRFWEAVSVETANKLILKAIEKNGSETAKKNPEKFLIQNTIGDL